MWLMNAARERLPLLAADEEREVANDDLDGNGA